MKRSSRYAQEQLLARSEHLGLSVLDLGVAEYLKDEGFLPRLSLGPFTKMLWLVSRLQRLRKESRRNSALGTIEWVSGSPSP